MTTFGERVASLRNKGGMTQTDLADKMGVEQASVSRWEKDDATPDIHRMKALAAALDCTTIYLIGEDGEADPPNNIRALRKAKGITQEILAERIGTDKTMVSRLELGARTLSPKWLVAIADALEVAPEEITSDNGKLLGVSRINRLSLPATNEAALRLPEGIASLTIPAKLSPESIDDLEAWIAVTLRAMRRAAL